MALSISRTRRWIIVTLSTIFIENASGLFPFCNWISPDPTCDANPDFFLYDPDKTFSEIEIWARILLNHVRVKETKGLMSISRRLLAYAFLITIVTTVIPIVALLLLDRLSDGMYLGLLIAFFLTLPLGLSLAASYVLAKGYVGNRQGSSLTFGAATLMWGWANVAVIVFVFIASSLNPGWAAISVGVLLSSLLHFSGAFASGEGSLSEASAKFRLALTYAAVTVAAAVLSYAAFEGATLSLFDIGGGTILDVSFTSASIVMFSLSSVLFLRKTRRTNGMRSYGLYSFGLALFALATIPALWGQGGVSEAGYLYGAATLGGCLCFFVAALLLGTKRSV